MLLAAMLWLSGVVIDHLSWEVWTCTRKLIDHRHVNVFVRVLNFHGWSQPRNYFNSEIFQFFNDLFTVNKILST